MSENSTEKFFDLIIICGGPAGLTAGLYASRAKLNTILLERGLAGGQVAGTGFIDNYPGIKRISGVELATQMEEHAREFGLDIDMAEVKCINREEERFCVETSNGKYYALAIILTTGVHPRLLGVPGEKEYKGKGVSYCAICDGFFYNGKHVAVIGGGDSAVEEGTYLTKFADRVSIIHRRDSLRAQKLIQEKAFENPKIEFIWNTRALEILGDSQDLVAGLKLLDIKSNREYTIDVDGVFIYVGTIPNTFLCDLGLKADDMGFILTDEKMMTSVEGIFAAGDVRSKPLRQIVTAVGDGALAAVSAEKYIEVVRDRMAEVEKQRIIIK